MWLRVVLIALMALPVEAATPHAALNGDAANLRPHENQLPSHGLGPVEFVTSDVVFEPSLLSQTPTPSEPAIARDEERNPAVPSKPRAASRPHEDMVKWFGIFGFVLLLMRSARRR